MGGLGTFIVNVFAGVRGRQPPASWYGPWTMVHFPWSMDHGPSWLPLWLMLCFHIENVEKLLVFHDFLYGGTAAAPHPHRTRTLSGTDNSAPAENVHNKNPSLTLSGKIAFYKSTSLTIKKASARHLQQNRLDVDSSGQGTSRNEHVFLRHES